MVLVPSDSQQYCFHFTNYLIASRRHRSPLLHPCYHNLVTAAPLSHPPLLLYRSQQPHVRALLSGRVAGNNNKISIELENTKSGEHIENFGCNVEPKVVHHHFKAMIGWCTGCSAPSGMCSYGAESPS